MEVINIIELIDNSIICNDCFVITDQSKKQSIIEKAEKLFAAKALENLADENEIKSLIKYGYYENDNYTLLFSWGRVNN